MGTDRFFKNAGGGKPPNMMNLTARSIGAASYAGKAAGAGAAKDIAAAKALASNGMKPLTKTAASNAPGPKKV